MSDKPYPTELSLCEGKYTIHFDLQTGRSECLHYGEPWRELHGDKLILAMFDRIVELESLNEKLIESAQIQPLTS